MKDQRIVKLAQNLLDYSVNLQKGDKIQIVANGLHTIPLVKELVRIANEKGGVVFHKMTESLITKEEMKNFDEKALEEKAKIEIDFMKKMDAYIAIRGDDNSFELSDVPDDKMTSYIKIMREVTDVRVSKKWALLRYPTGSMAQNAKMGTEAFEEHYFNVCNLDYSKMDNAMNALKTLMEKSDKVRILSPKNDTDLTFSIKNLPAIKCAGNFNIPDGEVFTAPVKETINGKITFNADTVYDGKPFSNIHIEFKDGKAITATASDTKGLNSILDKDKGARFVGEFAFGVNPYIHESICDILFDEKITGSIHMALGKCYDECDNGNKSVNHWDMIHIQTPKYGGGEIYLDDVLIRKDGLFVIEELKPLNPENLK